MPEATVEVPSGAAMRDLGRRLARLLRPGDLVVLSGDLGAGKTTLTQGVAAGLGVRGEVTSPTFVIAREHPGRVPLVHVDAYRLGGVAEVDDLDLDTGLADAVTVVEWGAGLVEGLAPDRLELTIRRPYVPDRPAGAGAPGEPDASAGGSRTVHAVGVGARWADVDLAVLASP